MALASGMLLQTSKWSVGNVSKSSWDGEIQGLLFPEQDAVSIGCAPKVYPAIPFRSHRGGTSSLSGAITSWGLQIATHLVSGFHVDRGALPWFTSQQSTVEIWTAEAVSIFSFPSIPRSSRLLADLGLAGHLFPSHLYIECFP